MYTNEQFEILFEILPIKNLVFQSVLVILPYLKIGEKFFILPKLGASSSIVRQCSSTMMNKFEVFQKKYLKWILSEQKFSYSYEVYIKICRQVNILPLFFRFNLNDMYLVHKIVYKTIPINMPDYFTHYSGDSRLRRTHLDNLSFLSNIASTTTRI